ncbi:MAG: transketolase [Planctomycetota bacterium]
MSFEAAVHAQAIDLDRLSAEMCASAGSGHTTSALSLGHIVTVLMFHSMRWSPEYPEYPTSDRLVLSSGHSVPVVYAASARLGVMVGKGDDRRRLTEGDLSTLREWDSVLEGHPNPMEGFPFFDAATGSLGMGLSVAAGIGKAAQLDGSDRRVFCVLGDGEAREGQVTEALDFIVDHKLRNVLPIFNCNEYGQAGRVSDQQSAENIARRLDAMGFDSIEIDGHAPEAIKAAFDEFVARSESDGDVKPVAVVAKTVKGWGAPSIQGGGWHGKPPTGDALERVLGELNERQLELTTALGTGDQFTIQPPAEATANETPAVDIPPMSAFMKSIDMESVLHSGRLATRKAYGLALRAMGRTTPELVVLDADVSNSTFAETFAKDGELSDRFIECKIAEQNMVSVGAGMAAAGKIPFCSTFSKFVTRAYDQIEMAMNSGANLKIVGSHSGITLAADGPSQMSLPDVSWFRSLSTVTDHRGNPGCYILQPSDAFSAYALTGVMAEYEGLCYMRTLRADTEFLYSDDQVFNLGGFEVLQKGRDIVLCAAGYGVHVANEAIDLLDKAGVSATLVDMYSIPFDEDKLLDLVAQNGGYAISVEDNYGGGLGSAIADALVSSGDAFTLEQMFVRRIPKSARTPEQMLEMCGLTAQDVVNKVMEVLQVA